MRTRATADAPLDSRLTAVMALISGLVVANSYYAQPLVDAIAESLHASTTNVGLVVTASQIGYAVGLAMLVPLGDLVERRKLLAVMLTVTCAALVVMAAAPSWQVLASAAVIAGAGSVVGQVLVPLAASLASDDERGRVIGNVMTGLLLGILLSRVVAGLIAQVGGWRAVFVVAASLMVLAYVLVRTLPTVPPDASLTYRGLLASVVALVREERVLRWRIAYGTTTYASFGVFWTSVGFLLAGPAYGWSDARIGLFTLVGVAGALAARFAGRLADRGYAQRQTGLFVLATSLSFLLLAVGEQHVLALAAGVALLDLGIQGTHISNQSLFYPLRPDARSRLNTAYMTTYFLAGSIGSALSVVVYTWAGWPAVCALGAAFPALGFVLWVVESFSNRRSHLLP
ncbi:MFS transporter [Rhodococcus sp. BP-252]|nr:MULTISPECIES: MFS transporter [Rhodococcus]MBY6413523.1 MFS transporter [Rhodococcus sp. BP-320]MBY6418281.1 MFS transporter [Rhodococcus sp. BP-321]MBY6422695.1 MFS transporter [Rhodococcus sp. BP-324]MBY6428226.1 MFS transporter [Rhodococcus sp. BP-323]MBY6433403.1 MFS transporter [Rhodococcus sp. BP-322]